MPARGSQPIHLAVCDSHRATQYLATMEGGDRVHVTETATLASRWVDFHDHSRPMRLGMGPSAGAVQRYADEHHEAEELTRRFAREVARWLASATTRHPGSPLHTFAAPRFLGVLREELGQDWPTITLIRSELCGLRPGEIASHPAVQSLVRDAQRGEPSARSAEALSRPTARADINSD